MPEVLEYIWLDAEGNFRSKTRVVHDFDPEWIPFWSFDSSSTGHAAVTNSDGHLIPLRVTEPVEGKRLVLCIHQYQKIPENMFHDSKILIGFEQEYFVDYIDSESQYCSIKNDRSVMDRHMVLCIDAGLNISGTNIEVSANQREFQMGPMHPLDACHELMLARYLLLQLDSNIDLSPKPHRYMNGSGLHVNISKPGLTAQEIGRRLSSSHDQYLKLCGEGNELRLTGDCETSEPGTFTCKKGDRTASVKIKSCEKVLEDRRPGSNADPYALVAHIVEVLDEHD